MAICETQSFICEKFAIVFKTIVRRTLRIPSPAASTAAGRLPNVLFFCRETDHADDARKARHEESAGLGCRSSKIGNRCESLGRVLAVTPALL